MFGKPPSVVGQFDIDCTEMMFYLYLPVRVNGSSSWPSRLLKYAPLYYAALKHANIPGDWNIYVTAKTLHCAAGCLGARPGWHTDGFGTDDLNYIWCDRSPTVFCVQDGLNIRNDEHASMLDMEEQCRVTRTYPAGTLLALDRYVIHRPEEIVMPGVRTFFRLSFSPDPYNFLGNSINPNLDLGVPYVERRAQRNITTSAA